MITIIFRKKLPSMKEMPDLLIDEALVRTGGNKTNAAKMLRISRQALTRRIGLRRKS